MEQIDSSIVEETDNNDLIEMQATDKELRDMALVVFGLDCMPFIYEADGIKIIEYSAGSKRELALGLEVQDKFHNLFVME